MAVARKDSLGDRMKESYEARYCFKLPRRTYTIIRVDGRAFHTFTRGMKRPYDTDFMQCMDEVGLALCQGCAGAEMAFVQSDEVSVLLTDFRKIDTHAWFDGNLQKLCSITASVATAAFNMAIRHRNWDHVKKEVFATALFDSRVFIIPDPIEVDNYFRWRQKDAERNSVSMLAQAHASQNKLHGKNRAAQHDIIHEAGDNWNDHPADFKRGRAVVYRDQKWVVDHETPVFTKEPTYLKQFIPLQWPEEAEAEQV